MRATRANLLDHPPAELEVIPPAPGNCFRWFKHDYPAPSPAATLALHQRQGNLYWPLASTPLA